MILFFFVVDFLDQRKEYYDSAASDEAHECADDDECDDHGISVFVG